MGNLEMLKPSKRKRQKRRDKRLHEELIECYRVGGRWTGRAQKGYYKKQVGNEYEFSPKHEGIKVMSGGTKYQTDNLQPLIRFLDKNQGKYWDKVYSKLCRKMSKHSVIGEHLFDHLFDFVETRAFYEDGRLMVISAWGGVKELAGNSWYPQFYVHPESGVLLKVKRRKKRR